MTDSESQFTDEERDALNVIRAGLISEIDTVQADINRSIFSLLFTNTHTLSPLRFEEIGNEEVQHFFSFLSEPRLDNVRCIGQKRANEGLSLQSVLTIGSTISRLCMLKIAQISPTMVHPLTSAINKYRDGYLEAYFFESKQITLRQQKEIRQALTRSLEGHRLENTIQKHAIDTSINAILLTDIDGSVTYANLAFLDLWGYVDLQEIVGHRGVDLFVGEDATRVFQSLHKINSWKGESKAVRKNGTVFDVEMFASMIKDENRVAIGSMASFVDITERKRSEAQFRQAQKMEALGQLAGGISHDFNNMLSAIKGYLDLILIDMDKDTQTYSDLIQIKTAVDRCSGLTKQLRRFAKEETGEQIPTDINSLVSENYELIKHTVPPEIEIKTQMEKNLWCIEADPSQLAHVLMNFCVNARDAILEKSRESNNPKARGGYSGTVTLDTHNVVLDDKEAKRFLDAKPGRYVRLRIADTGIGMTHDIIDRLYEPFFTTKKKFNGTGLGLSIIYRIVKKHRGFIDVRSEPDKGSVFEVYFPTSESLVKNAAASDTEPETTSCKETILVVDDESQILNFIERLLVRCGYRVITANNGKQAITIYKLQKTNIDLVILDMIMPEMGGRACYQQLQSINPNIKVLISTGYTTDTSYKEMLREGVVGVIEKPFEIYKISRTIKNVLQNRMVSQKL